MSRQIFAVTALSALFTAVPSVVAQKDTIQIDVDLMLVNATVTDGTNRRVTGLAADQFQLWEDKIQQKIEYFSSEEEPVSVAVILDVSNSMKDKIAVARNAVATFLQAGGVEDEYLLVEFRSRPELAQGLTTDISKLRDRLLLTSTRGMTAMYDAVYLGLEQLKDSRNSKRALLLITDGEDNHSRYRIEDIKQFIQEQDVRIFGIGITSDVHSRSQAGHAAIQELVDVSGGEAFFPASVDELEDICSKIATQLKNQYVLGYRSTNQMRDGRFRKIHVKVATPAGMHHLAVHARSGYYFNAPVARVAGPPAK